MLEQQITQLVEELGLPPSSKDPNGYFQIAFSNNLKISLKDLSPGFSILSFLSPIPTQNKEEAFSYLMKANFLGQGTGEQIIGIDQDEKFLTLSRTISYEVNYPKFKEILEEFVNYLAYWKDETKKMQTQQSAV